MYLGAGQNQSLLLFFNKLHFINNIFLQHVWFNTSHILHPPDLLATRLHRAAFAKEKLFKSFLSFSC